MTSTIINSSDRFVKKMNVTIDISDLDDIETKELVEQLEKISKNGIVTHDSWLFDIKNLIRGYEE